jgi:hypothetical protein
MDLGRWVRVRIFKDEFSVEIARDIGGIPYVSDVIPSMRLQGVREDISAAKAEAAAREFPGARFFKADAVVPAGIIRGERVAVIFYGIGVHPKSDGAGRVKSEVADQDKVVDSIKSVSALGLAVRRIDGAPDNAGMILAAVIRDDAAIVGVKRIIEGEAVIKAGMSQARGKHEDQAERQDHSFHRMPPGEMLETEIYLIAKS